MKDLQKLNETIEQIKLDLDLNFDTHSIFLLENQIDWMYEQIEDFDLEPYIHDYALFFGQCLINEYGGKWIIDPSTKKLMISLKSILIINPIEVINAYYNKSHYTTSFSLFFKGLSYILPLKKQNK